MEQKEKILQNKVLNDLRSFGKYCECFKLIKASDNGFGDIFFTFKTTGAVFLEMKKPSGKLEKLQEKKIRSLNECGTKAYPCYSWEDWMEIKKSLGIEKIMLSQ